MFNKELYKKLEHQFGIERMKSFAEIMAVRHDILFTDSDESLNGEDFERDWWINKLAELSSIPKEENNKDDYSLTNIRRILKERGYKSILDIPFCNDFNEEIFKKHQ